MKYGNRILSLMGVAALSILLAACGQSSNCNGISFGTTGGSSSGSNGGVNSGGSVCGGGNSNGNGNGSVSAFMYYISSGPVIAAANITAATFANVNGFSPINIGTSTGLSVDMLIVNQKFLYLPVMLSGSLGAVQAYSITHGTAALTPVTGSPFATSQAETGPSTADPKGRFLFVGDASDSQIAVFQIDASTGALTPAPGSPFTVLGLAPHNLAVDGTGTYLYVGDKLASIVYGFSIDQNTGAISPIPGSPFGVGLLSVQGEPSGKFLLGVDGSTPGLFVLGIEAGTGALISENIFPTTNAPSSLAVHPSGLFAYTFAVDARGNGLPLEGFQLDGLGNATTLSGSPFTTLAFPIMGKFDQGGTHLVSPLNSSGFAAFAVSNSTGAVTDPLPHLSAINDNKFAVTN
jgi:6-phosphogluconolactonase